MEHDSFENEAASQDFASASLGSSRSNNFNSVPFPTNTNNTPFRSRNHPDGPPPLSTSGFKPLPPEPPTPAGFKGKLLPLKGTMDPFTIRMNFKRAYLEKLTSSPGNQARAAAYALKYREQDEDLHQCIFETLENVRTHLAPKDVERQLMETVQYQPKSQCHVLHRATVRTIETRRTSSIHRYDRARHGQDHQSGGSRNKSWSYESQGRAKGKTFSHF